MRPTSTCPVVTLPRSAVITTVYDGRRLDRHSGGDRHSGSVAVTHQLPLDGVIRQIVETEPTKHVERLGVGDNDQIAVGPLLDLRCAFSWPGRTIALVSKNLRARPSLCSIRGVSEGRNLDTHICANWAAVSRCVRSQKRGRQARRRPPETPRPQTGSAGINDDVGRG